MKSDSTRITAEPVAKAVHNRRLLQFAYIAVAVLYYVGMYLYVPTLPTYVQSKSENLALVGIVLAQYGLWQAIIRLPLGIAADWIGRRKPFLIMGMILAGLGAWLLGTAGSSSEMMVGRAITGLAAGTWVPLVVAFSSLFPPEEAIRASAILTFVGSAGRVAATSITGSLNAWQGYSLAFGLAAGAALLGALFLLFVREETNPPRRPSVASLTSVVTRRDVLLPSLLAAVSQYANWAITFSFLPIRAEQLGADGVTLSLLLSMNIAIVTISSLLVPVLARRIGTRRLVYGTFLLMSLGIGAGAIATSLLWIVIAQLCMGIGQGLNYPLLMGMSIQEVENGERTTAMGLHQSIYATGMFVGPWLSGILADDLGIRPMFGITAFAILGLSTILIRILPRAQGSPASS